MTTRNQVEEYDVTNFKPRDAYTKEEIEQMEKSKLECLKMLEEQKKNKD